MDLRWLDHGIQNIRWLSLQICGDVRAIPSKLCASWSCQLPGAPALLEHCSPYSLVQLSLWKEWRALVTSFSACWPYLGSLVCCCEWLRRCVLWSFPFVGKLFISLCVVDVYSQSDLQGGEEMPAQMTFLLFWAPWGAGCSRHCHWLFGNC